MKQPEYTLQERVERGEQVKALTEQPGWSVLIESVQARVDDRLKVRMGEKGEQPVDYAKTVGQVAGLRELEQIAAQTIKAGKDAEADIEKLERTAGPG